MIPNQKVAIITGGNSRIGRATAVALAKEGVKVAIAARQTPDANFFYILFLVSYNVTR